MSSGCGDVLSLADLQTAKKHQIFEAEVITGKSGGVAGGANIDYATNAVTGQTQKTLPAVLRDAGFRPASFTFETGGTLGANDADLAVLWPGPSGDGNYYAWKGALPKTIPASSTPASTGGVGQTAWVAVSEAALRRDLALSTGAGLVGTTSGRTVQAEFDILKMGYKTLDDFGAKGDGSTDDTAAILNAFSWASTNGLPLRVPSKTYVWNGEAIPYDNVALIGDKRPYADSGLTRLLGGSIIVGTLRFSGKNVQISNIGVDHGSFRFPSTAGDALTVSAPEKSGQYCLIRNCIGLGRNPTDAFHAILCEGYKYSIIEDCIGMQNTYSLAHKSGYSITNNIISRNSNTGVIVKSDSAFGDASFSNITNITIDGNGNCNIGLWVFAQDAQLQKVNVSNIVASGCKYDMVVQADAGVINEININNLASSGASIASLALVANAADKIYTANISNISAGEVTGQIIDAQATNLLNISNVNGRITSSSTHVNDSIKIGALVGASNLVNVIPTLNYSLISQAGVTFNNAFDKNSISNVRAAIYGSGAPRPGYATQDASGASGVLSVRYSQTNSSFIKLTLPSGAAEIATINTTAINGSVIPEGYVLWIQNATSGQNLTITPSTAGHIVTTGNTPKVLAGGDKVGFMFDGNTWIQM